MFFVFIWEQTATCATYSINWLVFITEIKSVYWAVRNESLNKAVCHSSLKGQICDYLRLRPAVLASVEYILSPVNISPQKQRNITPRILILTWGGHKCNRIFRIVTSNRKYIFFSFCFSLLLKFSENIFTTWYISEVLKAPLQTVITWHNAVVKSWQNPVSEDLTV